jgi:hypothetical protein
MANIHDQIHDNKANTPQLGGNRPKFSMWPSTSNVGECSGTNQYQIGISSDASADVPAFIRPRQMKEKLVSLQTKPSTFRCNSLKQFETKLKQAQSSVLLQCRVGQSHMKQNVHRPIRNVSRLSKSGVSAASGSAAQLMLNTNNIKHHVSQLNCSNSSYSVGNHQSHLPIKLDNSAVSVSGQTLDTTHAAVSHQQHQHLLHSFSASLTRASQLSTSAIVSSHSKSVASNGNVIANTPLTPLQQESNTISRATKLRNLLREWDKGSIKRKCSFLRWFIDNNKYCTAAQIDAKLGGGALLFLLRFISWFKLTADSQPIEVTSLTLEALVTFVESFEGKVLDLCCHCFQMRMRLSCLHQNVLCDVTAIFSMSFLQFVLISPLI